MDLESDMTCMTVKVDLEQIVEDQNEYKIQFDEEITLEQIKEDSDEDRKNTSQQFDNFKQEMDLNLQELESDGEHENQHFKEN